MNKIKIFAAILIITNIGLVGCGSSSSSETKTDPRNNLTDLELAKDYTKRFVNVGQAILDMQQPMIETTELFIKDSREVDTDEVDASLGALSTTLYLALTVVKDALIQNSDGDVIGVDYSNIPSSTALAQLLNNECDSDPCMANVELTTGANVTYSDNVLSVTNAQVSTELFTTYYDWSEERVYKELRDESKGVFTNTISFEIKLPKFDLNGTNEVAFGISKLNLQTDSSLFAITMEAFGVNGKIDGINFASLNQLLNSGKNINATEINANLTNAEIKFGAANFIGNVDLNVVPIDNVADKASAKISGLLTNSQGDSIKANLDLGVTNYKSDDEDNYQEIDGYYEWENTEASSESFDFDFDLELIYTSIKHGELSVKLSALGKYSEASMKETSNKASRDNNQNKYESSYSYSDQLLADGGIEVRVAGEELELSYGIKSEGKESEEGSYSANTEGSQSEYKDQENSINSIIITDASYTERNLYITINTEFMTSHSYSSENEEGKSSRINNSDIVSGVFVGGVQYGEFSFDALTNTSVMAFTDGEKISLNN